jgi:hypothetical protein
MDSGSGRLPQVASPHRVALALSLALLGAGGCGSSTAGSPSDADGGLEPDGSPTGDSATDSATRTGSHDSSVQGSLDASESDDGPATTFDAAGTSDAGNEVGDSAGTDASPEVDAGASTVSPYGPNLVSIFDGTSLAGWTQVPSTNPPQWSVVDGAMHSSGANRGFMYSANRYGDFRFIFTSRLISDEADGATPHVPCVLFWGTSTTADAMDAIQVQPPKGYMWDYRPGHNDAPAGSKFLPGRPSLTDTNWSQCEMLAAQATGMMRFACCQVTGTAPCKATEIMDYTDATAGQTYYVALQVHTGNSANGSGMIEEFKDLYIESPVADPTQLLTTQ